jgi:hypothetical protein
MMRGGTYTFRVKREVCNAIYHIPKWMPSWWTLVPAQDGLEPACGIDPEIMMH